MDLQISVTDFTKFLPNRIKRNDIKIFKVIMIKLILALYRMHFVEFTAMEICLSLRYLIKLAIIFFRICTDSKINLAIASAL